jgi:hypothetical protein
MQSNLGVSGFGFILAGYGLLFSCSGAWPAPTGNPFAMGSSGVHRCGCPSLRRAHWP